MTNCSHAGGCAGTNYPFLTLKERDIETGLDYFNARYYSSTQGRFRSPDEFKGGPEELFGDIDPHDPLLYAEIAEPQSLNKYQYCLNNPLRYIDPDGHQTATADVLKAAAIGGAATGQPEVVAGAAAAAAIYIIVDKTVGWDKVADWLRPTAKDGDWSCPECIDTKFSKDNGGQQGAQKEVVIDGNKHPESATNAADAQKSGQPKTVSVGNPADKGKRRAEAMKGNSKVPGKDRDEYPPAWSAQGGRGATVKPISPGDNRGSGASMGRQLNSQGAKPGDRVRIKVINVPKKNDQ